MRYVFGTCLVAQNKQPLTKHDIAVFQQLILVSGEKTWRTNIFKAIKYNPWPIFITKLEVYLVLYDFAAIVAQNSLESIIAAKSPTLDYTVDIVQPPTESCSETKERHSGEVSGLYLNYDSHPG